MILLRTAIEPATALLQYSNRGVLFLVFNFSIYLHCNSGRKTTYSQAHTHVKEYEALICMCQDVKNDVFHFCICGVQCDRAHRCLDISVNIHLVAQSDSNLWNDWTRLNQWMNHHWMNGRKKERNTKYTPRVCDMVRSPITIANFNYHLLRDIKLERASCQLCSSISEMPPRLLQSARIHTSTILQMLGIYKRIVCPLVAILRLSSFCWLLMKSKQINEE